jgi:flagellum-specific peptidoglycan hydrolase FlgJ
MSHPNTKPYVNPLCNHQPAVDFVRKIHADCKTLADQLDVPVENLLGLAAEESQYGSGRIAKTYNNYFSMHAPAPFQKGAVPSQKNPKVKVATYDSFFKCGESFVERFGDRIRGIKDPTEFAKTLVKVHFNTGDSKTGGRDDFVPYLVQIIKSVKVRMIC